ncbi:MAG: hypothetical protein HS101_05610 [Planctomycetia bacterium]|jgi:hypothetical protein|nr:hypothetical protein [Planctomycetia bacterium]MCC7314867.1 hypothetical protein [Planctomycetota bacterium]
MFLLALPTLGGPVAADAVRRWVFHYLHDALGSVIGLVNDAGELVERYT